MKQFALFCAAAAALIAVSDAAAQKAERQTTQTRAPSTRNVAQPNLELAPKTAATIEADVAAKALAADPSALGKGFVTPTLSKTSFKPTAASNYTCFTYSTVQASNISTQTTAKARLVCRGLANAAPAGPEYTLLTARAGIIRNDQIEIPPGSIGAWSVLINGPGAICTLVSDEPVLAYLRISHDANGDDPATVALRCPLNHEIMPLQKLY